MALIKQNLTINFANGVNTKSDDKQVSPGQFLNLENSIFDKQGLLQKRNGYKALTSLPDSMYNYVTTFSDNLTAIGTSLTAYSSSNQNWVNKGTVIPASLDTLPLIRSNTNQTFADTAIVANGLICTVYSDFDGSTTLHKYAIADSITGQNIIEPTLITPTAGTVTGSPRVFLLGAYFIIVFTTVITATSHLQYIAIGTGDPTNTTTAVDIAPAYTSDPSLSWDGVVTGNKLFVAYNTQAGGQSIRIAYLNSNLVLATFTTFNTQKANTMSLCVDETIPQSPIIYATYFNSSTQAVSTFAVDTNLNPVLNPTVVISGALTLTIPALTSIAQNQKCTIFVEVSNTYGYNTVRTDYISSTSITQMGVVGPLDTIIRSVGLASKAALVNGQPYVAVTYSSPNQPTYFLINATGQIITKLAYSNGGGYLATGLPSTTVNGSSVKFPYLIKDLAQAVSKRQNVPAPNGIYTQTGVNLATITLGVSTLTTAEIASTLNITGGITWSYDGYVPVEQGFHVWPDNIVATTDTTGGFMSAQSYYYQVTYEWSDNQGNIIRSAPSIPTLITTTGSTSLVTLKIPTLRLTYRIANPVKIVIYRWGVDQQNYYQVTSVLTPLLNDPTVDYVTYVDTQEDAVILGNSLIYTTGNVVENIGPPAFSSVTLFKSRLVGIDAEDKNLLWYSKQVIESTPVEMSDLFTIYVAPTTSAQGATGPMRALSALDDKLIIFKRDAIYYIVGNGPDNTGANNDFSDPIFITSTVGSSNQRSIVFMPQGLMFESDKGIWLLGRDLSTTYIGAPVESFTQNATVQSAVNVPGTNQVRFTMSSGITLMYDYYYNQWGTFTNVPAVSSTLYNSLHTYINERGQVYQETPGVYLDGSSPVLRSFTTGWMSLAGLQGFERFYQMYLLGQYITPFKLRVDIGYDYDVNPSQSVIVLPDNFSGNYGSGALYGNGSPYGGPSKVFEARIFPERQKCETFQFRITEIYDPSYGIPAGEGFTLSGLTVVVGVKKSYRTSPAAKSFG